MILMDQQASVLILKLEQEIKRSKLTLQIRRLMGYLSTISLIDIYKKFGPLVQEAETRDLKSFQCGFESHGGYTWCAWRNGNALGCDPGMSRFDPGSTPLGSSD